MYLAAIHVYTKYVVPAYIKYAWHVHRTCELNTTAAVPQCPPNTELTRLGVSWKITQSTFLIGICVGTQSLTCSIRKNSHLPPSTKSWREPCVHSTNSIRPTAHKSQHQPNPANKSSDTCMRYAKQIWRCTVCLCSVSRLLSLSLLLLSFPMLPETRANVAQRKNTHTLVVYSLLLLWLLHLLANIRPAFNISVPWWYKRKYFIYTEQKICTNQAFWLLLIENPMQSSQGI